MSDRLLITGDAATQPAAASAPAHGGPAASSADPLAPAAPSPPTPIAESDREDSSPPASPGHEPPQALVAVNAGASTTVAPSLAARAAVVDPVVVGRWRRAQLRPSLTILLFLIGVVGGILPLTLPAPVRPVAMDGTPSLERSAIEPFPAAAVAETLAANDVHGLAQAVDADTLTNIQTQLKPLVRFESVTFVGATAKGNDTLAGYAVRGRDGSGTLGIVGLLIRLRDGKVVLE